MKRLRYSTGALAAALWTAPLVAQTSTGTVRGRVVDNATQQALSGATITVGSRGALTQADGRYVIAGVPAGTDSVRARMLGYAPSSQAATLMGGDTAVVDFALTAQALNLSEVVVVGYGEQRAGNVSGAVKQLNSDEFNTGRIISPEQLLESKVAGVQVVDNNEPGGGLSVRIRGASSVNASSDPLFVIDGVPVGTGAGGGIAGGRNPLNFLNPNDIESITVLKDASSAAIYGANAANGVVLIRTKPGGRAPQIEYSASTSGSTVTRLPNMLNAEQFRTAVQQYAPQNVSQLGPPGTSTDWFSLVDRTGFGQDHNVAVSGSGEAMNYRLSVGYLNQDGIIRGTTTERLSLGLNYEQRLFQDRLDVRTYVKGSRAADQFTPGGVLSNAAQMGPTQPVYDPSSKTGYYDWPGNLLTSADNPVAILNLASDHSTTYRSIGNVQAAYSLPFLEALKVNLNLGYDVTKAERITFRPSVLHSETKTGNNGNYYRENPSQVNTGLEAYLNYAAPLNVLPGTIDLTGGYSYSQSNADYPWIQAKGLTTDLLTDNGIPSAREVQPGPPNVQESKLISFFGRVNYNINDRYLVAASLRRDGSSRFGTDNAWGTFPAVSLAWRLSQESFLRNVSAISDLKLRASWGKTGNQAFANYQQYSTYLVGDAQTQVQFGNQFVSTMRPGAYDRDIKWESTNAYDVGLDYGFGNQRFSGSIDWYLKNTDDLIFTVPVAAGTNLSNFLTTNIGSMKNYGVELSLSARIFNKGAGGLSWTADFNAANNTNRLTSINPFAGSAQQILTGRVAGGVGTDIQVLQPYYPINSFFVCRQNYQNGKPVENSYLDAAGNVVTGCLNTNRRAFHDPAPKWILGHSSYLAYHNLDLSFTLRAYLGNWVYNNVASNLGTYQEVGRGSPYNLHASVLETGFKTPQYLSDYYVEDASFLRMDNMTLSYGFNYRGRPTRLFATVQNAFTITGYSGVDPTAGLNGLDNNIYPRSRTFTGGLSVKF